MFAKEDCLDAVVHIVDEHCTIYPRRRAAPIVTRVLGRRVADGVESIYLDRMVHEPHHTHVADYRVSGAVTTILQRPYGLALTPAPAGACPQELSGTDAEAEA
ncbi:hypothetical protein E4T66_17535 [Sinimarinibacterium sp. CAU 1509]|uniref:hypothetical protein n=1 Tax=Sinimarinibacterium sp. CAU 1509 TaxID=2562283 RepID=UPI0010AD5BB9|nr:hypothetical protein [Sinimarinibacterium sp. CAU 1509]TJY57211.1 hypothetical protein E4T66_17535 [Sinimarinibacterium sp. CAU 1509]